MKHLTGGVAQQIETLIYEPESGKSTPQIHRKIKGDLKTKTVPKRDMTNLKTPFNSLRCQAWCFEHSNLF